MGMDGETGRRGQEACFIRTVAIVAGNCQESSSLKKVCYGNKSCNSVSSVAFCGSAEAAS